MIIFCLLMRTRIKRRAIYNTFAVLLIACSACLAVTGQSLGQKLDQQTDYHIRTVKPDERLIEVARHFQIPMAIEWLDQPAPIGVVYDLLPV